MLSPLPDRVKEDLFDTIIGGVALVCDWNAETLDIVEALEYIHIKAEAV